MDGFRGRTPDATSVLLIGDSRLYLEALVAGLDRHAAINVLGAAETADGIALVMRVRPEVALIDIAFSDGMRILRELAADAPSTKLIALAVADADEFVITCAEAGVAGYVSRDASLADLVETIESVARGEAVCSPRIVARLIERLACLAGQAPPTHPGAARLTPREAEIIALIDEGLSNKEISARLCIEVATVKNHVHNALEKLQVSRRGEAAAALRRASNGHRPLTGA